MPSAAQAASNPHDPKAALPVGIDLEQLSALAKMLGVPEPSVAPEASSQEREQAVASAVVAEAAHQQQEQAGQLHPQQQQHHNSTQQLQSPEEVNAQAATFLQGLLGVPCFNGSRFIMLRVVPAQQLAPFCTTRMPVGYMSVQA